MSFKSGFTNEYSTVRWEKAPGPLREAAGFYYQEFSNLTKPLALKDDPFGVGQENQVSVWAEFIIPESAEVLGSYDHPFFGNYPAITRNNYGSGSLTYQGTHLSLPLQSAVLKDVLQKADLLSSDQELPSAVRVKHATSSQGKPIHFYLNFSGDSVEVDYNYPSGKEMLQGEAVSRGASLILKPWDLAIVME